MRGEDHRDRSQLQLVGEGQRLAQDPESCPEVGVRVGGDPDVPVLVDLFQEGHDHLGQVSVVLGMVHLHAEEELPAVRQGMDLVVLIPVL